MALVIPRCLVSDLLALVHCQHGRPRIAWTLSILRDRFHWPGMCRGTRKYVLSFGCRRRKRSRSQHMAILTARFLTPWEVLEVNLQRFPNTSEAGNSTCWCWSIRRRNYHVHPRGRRRRYRGSPEYFFIYVSRSGYPRSLKQTEGGDLQPLWEHLCQWRKVTIEFASAYPLRGQGSVTRSGAWMHDVLSEICKTWASRRDKYVTPACWIKRTTPDSYARLLTPLSLEPFLVVFRP